MALYSKTNGQPIHPMDGTILKSNDFAKKHVNDVLKEDSFSQALKKNQTTERLTKALLNCYCQPRGKCMHSNVNKMWLMSAASLATVTSYVNADGDTAQMRNMENRLSALEQKKGAGGVINPSGTSEPIDCRG